MTLLEHVQQWFREEGAWWLASLMAHMLGLCALAVVSVHVVPAVVGDAPVFEGAAVEKPAADDAKLDHFEVGQTPLDPSELSTETLTLEPAGQLAQEEKFYDENTEFKEAGGGTVLAANQPALGGMGGFDVKAIGPGVAVVGAGGVGAGVGAGKNMGVGGDGIGFGARGQGSRKAMVGRFGGTRQSERAVAAALNWLYRHQSADGSWSLAGYQTRCKDGTCTGPGNANANSAATAMALLPFLAAGQTHESRGPYKKCIAAGITWLLKNQARDGDLRAGHNLYSHGLATIVLCEDYGLSRDKLVGEAAQKAVNFIQAAQNPATGGWRYVPGQAGDTSVLGWQLMALKSAQMAGLTVSPAALDGARNWLKAVTSGYGEQFAYLPGGRITLATSSVGLLCRQYLGAKRGDPAMISGAAYLMEHAPDHGQRNVYYWYYATQVMHNFSGPQWDDWNRKMRRVLIDTQAKEHCAAGSWDPDEPSKDAWGAQGGRLMVTSLSALTLEVYYRYLPLYKLDTEDEETIPTGKGDGSAAGSGPAKPSADETVKPEPPANAVSPLLPGEGQGVRGAHGG